MIWTLILLLFCVSLSSSGLNTIPSYLKLCKQSDPNLDDCLKTTINDLKPYLGKGIPQMKIVSLDPLKIPKLVLRVGDNLEATFTEVELRDLIDFNLKYVHFDLNNLQLNFGFHFPKIRENGKYGMKGRLLIFNLRGSGYCSINFTNVDIDAKLKANKIQKNGNEYLDFNRINMDVKIEDGRINLENLFENNKQLTDQTNYVLNENSKAIISDFTPVVTDALKNVILQICKNVFDSFPLEKLLPK